MDYSNLLWKKWNERMKMVYSKKRKSSGKQKYEVKYKSVDGKSKQIVEANDEKEAELIVIETCAWEETISVKLITSKTQPQEQ